MTDKKSAAGISLGKEVVPDDTAKPHRPKKLERTLFPDPASGQGGPPATIENVECLIEQYAITVRYNVISKKTEIVIPDLAGTTDNYDNNAITHVCSIAARHSMATSSLPAIIETIADRNPYNPVADWIRSEPWDGENRLDALCETLETAEEFPLDLKWTLIGKWLLSAVAAAIMTRGFHSRGVLTLQGPQSIGKTSWCRSLIPVPWLRDIALKLDHHLDGNNKDSIIGAITHWIVEIGELDSSFKRDIARLKGFLTNDKDKIRRPYARVEAEYARRTVFLATVNQADFLVDHTGNSRWWTIPVMKIDYEHTIDMQQLFAQLAVRLDAGDQWWLTQDEELQLEAWNSRHRSFSLVEDLLAEVVDWSITDPALCKQSTATELLFCAGIDHPTNPQAKECAAILREHLGEPKRINGKMKWRVPIRPDAKNQEGFGDQSEPPARRFD
jgi:putative DNA primase/helicase